MAFGKKKKKEEVPAELPKLETEVVEAGTTPEQPKEAEPEVKVSPELKVMLDEFSTNYNGIVNETTLMAMSNSSEKAMLYNLLFAIYGEQIKQRKLMEAMLAEE